jgi:nitroreductase
MQGDKKVDQDTIKTALKEAINRRCSTRSYTKQQMPDDLLEEIVDAGRHAPSASNRQNTHFYVITNAEKLDELKAVMTHALLNVGEGEGLSPSIISLGERAKRGEVDVTYGAPTLIVTTNMKGQYNAPADCACAMQNMMLTASALGLANCWINQFFSLRDKRIVREFFESIGLTEEEDLFGALAVGYSENLATAPKPITGNPVKYIR